MATDAKNSNANEIHFFSRTAGYIWLKVCMEYELGLDVQEYQTEKKSLAELGHCGISTSK